MTSPKSTKQPSFMKGLSKEAQKKQSAFFNVRVRHRKLDELLDDLALLLTAQTESNIIFVVGATGVGKSTMNSNLLGNLSAFFAEEEENDASVISIVYVEAYANGETRHGFRALYEDMLDGLHEPGTERKTAIEIKDGRVVLNPRRRQTIASLRRQIESAFKYRKSRICVIDEAFHMSRFAKEAAVMDTLKSVANKTGIKLVLVGSFDLLDFAMEHGQIARRTAILNFDHYHQDIEDDRKEFKEIVKKLTAKWPCAAVPNFFAISDDLMEASLGCVGLLKSLLLDASAMQLRNEGKWDSKFLVKAAKSSKLLKVVRKEIEAGESKVKDALFGESLWDEKALARLTLAMERVNG
ncbi:AAA family ATPase [Variovorax sp. RKNM96]|uniref:AAA family ATPase n=1 Tax=Variovorax sp. RKNM96 TaxID=2681552 RepID=UPI0019826251|nr:AAA family ATPase [Variovorax sp. RKNM96]QSI33250.1 AAA family ATPase [Variovorax sp. RKNM96]